MAFLTGADPVHAAVRAGGIGVWHWDAGSNTTAWDATLEHLFGLEPGTFGGTYDAWLELVHPDDRTTVAAAVERALATRSPYHVEHRVLLPDGTTRWLQGRGDVVVDSTGNVTGTTGCTWDVSAQVALSAEREGALEELAAARARDRTSRERLEFVADLTDVLAGADTFDEVVRRAARAAVPRLGDWCSIAVVDEAGTPTFEVAHVDPDMVTYAHELIRRFPYDPDAPFGVAHVIRTGELEFVPQIDDAVADERNLDPEARDVLEQLHLRSSIIVPLRKRGRTLGAMQFVASETFRSYTEDDVLLAQAVADRIASTLENRRLQAELHRNEFRAALDALLDDVTIARARRDETGRIVDFEIEFMNAVSRDGAGRGPADLVGRTVSEMYPGIVDTGLLAKYVEVVETGEPFVVDRMPYADRTPDGRRIEGWWSLRVVKFRDGYLASSRDDTQTVLAETQVRRAREREALARHAVVVLQTAALPSALPSLPGVRFGATYQAAAAELPVGGDWYDVFEIPAVAGLGVIIADVAGHGMEAAGVMLQMRNAMRAYAIEGAAPHEVLTRANSLLCGLDADHHFVTCTYSLLVFGPEPGTLTMRWATAGHPPTALLRAGTCHLLDGDPGPPLGVTPDAAYEPHRAALRSGDRLVWFTDGLIERRDEQLDTSMQRLCSTIGQQSHADPQELVDDLVTQLTTGVDRKDDIAAVVAQIDDGFC